MKLLLLLVCVVLSVGCAGQSSMQAIGARNAAGAPMGDYRIVSAVNATLAQGRFQEGKMEGKWDFFDSHHVKCAEITYQNGVRSGPFQTFFGSVFNPAAAGKLESKGRFQNGQVVGQHIAYDSDGKVFSDATFEAGAVRHVAVGPQETATRTANAEIQLVQILEGVVHSAVH